MRTRPSGSPADEKNGGSGPEAVDNYSQASHHGKVPRVSNEKSARLDAINTIKDRRKSAEMLNKPPVTRPGAWQTSQGHALARDALVSGSAIDTAGHDAGVHRRTKILRSNPWRISLYTLLITLTAILALGYVVQSFLSRQCDTKGCRMSYMRPAFVRFLDFDTEHTRFASKYSLYLYREGGVDEDVRVKGIPVLFIPGNAGSYKQVRPLAAEAATYFHDVLRQDEAALQQGKRTLDFFSVDFNEDITAFHGQTLLDQAEYLNEAISFILSLYHNPQRSLREHSLPDPTSVIVIGHSMGGIVARTMLTMPNYQSNSINTIVTLAATHARPPVSFDSDIINTYTKINDYWRSAYAQEWANNNPLWHVTLISIAGGGLDTIVPSDYASTASIVPDTHGFTVFTSSIPHVWTGMDHLAIMWCDQLRKSIIRSLYDVVDVSRPTQTRPRAERLRSFKKWLLTGMENIAERTLPQHDPDLLLTLEDQSNTMLPPGERLALREIGGSSPGAHILPVPPQGTPERRTFTLLTNVDSTNELERNAVQVVFCSVAPLQPNSRSPLSAIKNDDSSNPGASTRLACKDAAQDMIPLPASLPTSQHPFEEGPFFSYLQYDLEDLAEYQFVAVVSKSQQSIPRWLVAEFSSTSDSTVQIRRSLSQMAFSKVGTSFPASRPLMTEIQLPTLFTSLLAYTVKVDTHECATESPLFSPLMRQYISAPYESKYFVNVKTAEVNLHGSAPYVPPALPNHSRERDGLTLQFWSDPTCNSTLDMSLEVDISGSLGKLVMRYRTVFAAFPIVVVAMALRKQLALYSTTGTFISLSQSIDMIVRSSLPLLFVSLTALATVISHLNQTVAEGKMRMSQAHWGRNATLPGPDYSRNDLLLGSPDPFFWFLMPLFGIIAVGVTVLVNYVALVLTHLIAFVYSRLRPAATRPDDGRRTPAVFAVASMRQRIITTAILIGLVSTVIPYQFAYLVLCLVQVGSCARALRLTWEAPTAANSDFVNYTHSVFTLMLWILPINVPVLVVWIHNLAVHWLTPFSSHHNILSVLPFVFLVEMQSTGRMLPRLSRGPQLITSLIFFLLAVFAAVYGVTYAFLLHHLVNAVCGWLVLTHLPLGRNRGPASVSRFAQMIFLDPLTGGSAAAAGINSPVGDNMGGNIKKRP